MNAFTNPRLLVQLSKVISFSRTVRNHYERKSRRPILLYFWLGAWFDLIWSISRLQIKRWFLPLFPCIMLMVWCLPCKCLQCRVGWCNRGLCTKHGRQKQGWGASGGITLPDFARINKRIEAERAMSPRPFIESEECKSHAF